MSEPSTIPFFGIAREYQSHRQEYLNLLDSVFSHGQVVRGKEVEELEETLQGLTNRKHAIAVNSATDALFFALRALGIGPGDEVLVTDFSFIASASCILRAGALPVFVDVDDSYNIDLKKAEKKITSQTKAIIGVHLYGRMIEPSLLEDFARRNKLLLVEDAAQAMGASSHDRHAGSLGSVSCISFDPTKVIGALGNGGAVLTDSGDFADAIKRMRYHGRTDKGTFDSLGYNSQMPSAIAKTLTFKLKHVENWFQRRLAVAMELSEKFGRLEGVIIPTVTADHSHIFHKYVIRVTSRDLLRQHLRRQGIEALVHYQHPLHRHACFASTNQLQNDFPNAVHFSETVLSLPIHPFLSSEEIQRMVAGVSAFVQHGV